MQHVLLNTDGTIDVSAAPTGSTHVVIRWITVNPVTTGAWAVAVVQVAINNWVAGSQHGAVHFMFGDYPITLPISSGNVTIVTDAGTLTDVTTAYNFI